MTKFIKTFEMYFNKQIPISDLGYVIVEEDGLFGLNDKDGNELLPALYSYISDTISVNNMIMVKDVEGEKTLIDLTPFEEDMEDDSDFGGEEDYDSGIDDDIDEQM